MSVPLPGDALTRYRLGLARHLARDSRLQGLGLPAAPVTIELVVRLAAGRASGVQVLDDGGFAGLAARAAERVRVAIRQVPVPPELGGESIRVDLGLRFEAGR